MERIHWVDRIRGLAMFSVVVQHMTYSYPETYVYHKTIAIGNMALFFFVSGFIANETTIIGNLRSLFRFLWKKTQQLAIPLLFWGLVVNHYFFASDYRMLTQQDILGQWKQPTLWFLLTLLGYMYYFGIYKWLMGLVYINKPGFLGGGQSFVLVNIFYS